MVTITRLRRHIPFRRAFVLIVLAGSVCVAGPVPAQPTPDSVRLREHSPRKALLRAALIPGWGQLYNRQYYKLPIVYAGLGGFIAGVVYMNDRYLLYRHAHLYARDPDAYPQYADEAAPFTRIIESGQEDLLRRQRENFQRNRDLFVLGVGLYYGLTLLDAFVSAHLRDFDVGEDLTVQLQPGLMPSGQVPLSATVHLRF